VWTAHFDERLEEWLDEIPPGIKARILRILDMLLAYGPHNVREPYVKPVKGHKKLFELRAKGKDGIARVFYFTLSEKRIILLHGFIKKSARTPAREIGTVAKRMKEAMEWLK
jgi:phage-related protein